MYTIVGSGFGLYGYLPALVERLGEEVVLPRAYEQKARARPELARALSGVRWAGDHDEALALAEGIVIATTPARQLEVAARCLSMPSIRRIVRKPIVPRRRETAAADLSRRASVTASVTRWLTPHGLRAFVARRDTSSVAIDGFHGAPFRATRQLEAIRRCRGGVLRFFGVRVLAPFAPRLSLLRAACGSSATLRRAAPLDGAHRRRRRAADAASRSTTAAARRSHIASPRLPPPVDLADPFAQERAIGEEDPRVGVVERILRALEEPDAPFEAWYDGTNALWSEAEAL